MSRRALVIAISALVMVGFVVAGYIYNRGATDRKLVATAQESTSLVRPHSPIMGRADAPVTIVEFFDPACETCRAFYPIVKKIMAEHPDQLRLVLRYTPFHKGADEVVRILETARKQGVFVPVLEAILVAQPEWADHHRPQIEKAWTAAASAGLNVEAARKEMLAPSITAVLDQDMADIRAVVVRQTPTFFVNGKPLPSFGAKHLQDLVRRD
jgi:protein-disulfide isomerase